ncbi:hypothetical protein Tco_0450537 [Tanacetum coccineum]
MLHTSKWGGQYETIGIDGILLKLVLPIFVYAVKHMLMLSGQVSAAEGEGSDNLTDSTPIPIIDQPSSSSQPKKDKLSKKVQRWEAEVPQDEAETFHKGCSSKEIESLRRGIQSRKGGKYQDLQGRSIEDIDADIDVSLVDETQERQYDDLIFDTGILDDVVEMHVEAKEPSKFRVPQEIKPSSSKHKGKGIMIEPEVPLKRKDQNALDEQIARDIQAKLDAELLEEQKLVRKQEEEANKL